MAIMFVSVWYGQAFLSREYSIYVANDDVEGPCGRWSIPVGLECGFLLMMIILTPL